MKIGHFWTVSPLTTDPRRWQLTLSLPLRTWLWKDIFGELGVTFWIISPGRVAGGGKK